MKHHLSILVAVAGLALPIGGAFAAEGTPAANTVITEAPAAAAPVDTPVVETSVATASQAEAPAANGAVVVPAPAPGTSQIVFYRPSAMGMAISCNIRENGKMLGTTNNGRYFILTTTPGPHTFTTKSEATDTLNLEAEADETSYVKCKIGMGFMAGRPNLSPSTKQEFDSKSAKLKLSDPEKMAHAIAEDDAKRIPVVAK